MKKFFKALFFLALVTTSIFFGVIYYDTYIASKDTTKSINNTVITSTSKTDTSAPITPISNIVYSVFPRTAAESGGKTINHTGGKGEDTLLDYLLLGEDIFVILSTDSEGFDYKAKTANLAVARFSLDGTLLDCVTLLSSQPVRYLACAPYENGIMLTGSTEGFTVIYAVTTALTYTEKHLPFTSDSAIMYDNYPYTVTVAADNARIRFLSFDGSLNYGFNYAETCESQVEFLSLYYTSGEYALFYNDGTRGNYLSFSEQGISRKKTLFNQPLASVLPSENGFVSAHCLDGTSYLTTLGFNLTSVQTTPLAEGTAVTLAPSGRGFLALVCDGRSTQAVTICRHGDVISKDCYSMSGITAVTDCAIGDTEIAILGTKGGQLALNRFDTESNCFTESVNLRVPDNLNARCFKGKTELFVLTDTLAANGDFAGNFGKTDVFLLLYK